jgi:hypothetical protein
MNKLVDEFALLLLDLSENEREVVVEASSLELKPGHFPSTISVCRSGTVRLFATREVHRSVPEGDIEYVKYEHRDDDGRREFITVLND